MFKIVAVLMLLTGEPVGIFPITASQYFTVSECRHNLNSDEVARILTRIIIVANADVGFSEAHIVGHAECREGIR